MSEVKTDIEGTIGESISICRKGSCQLIPRAGLLLAISVCGLLSGCKDVATIWSAESRSPDGQWIAIARTDQYGGPGNAGIYTFVTLKRTKGPKTPIDILTFSQETKSIDLKMIWLTSSHLEVSYGQNATLDSQTIKYGGIDISVRDLSGETSNIPRAPTAK
jgi:hypothetical protein